MEGGEGGSRLGDTYGIRVEIHKAYSVIRVKADKPKQAERIGSHSLTEKLVGTGESRETSRSKPRKSDLSTKTNTQYGGPTPTF